MSSVLPQAYFDKVRRYFHGDTTKTWMWFKSPNPALGMVSPLDVCRAGRIDKVKKVIDEKFKGY